MWAERRTAFNQWVNTQLREGVDYGKIPGIDKATLLKPGAEKIAQAYGCSPITEVTVRDQDPNTGYLYVEVAVRLVNIQSGAVIATGLGSCCSYESKYRYRWEWWNGRTAPAQDAGYEQTRGGKWRRRIENTDLVDQWNTVLKMAKKRALVDAALTVSGASEKFTQDVEDFDDGAPVETPKAEAPTAQAKAATPWIENPATRKRWWAWVADQGLANNDAYKALGVESLRGETRTYDECQQVVLAWVAQQQAVTVDA
jgi:hypothetical protein